MNIETRKLSELRHPEKNVRIHTPKQIEEYIRSLNMFGQVRPLVVDENGVILIGNGMYEALVRMGRDSCECEVKTGLTDAQKKKLMLADNKVYELGMTDADAFESILRDIGADFDIPGYESSMLEMLNMSFSEVDDAITGYGVFEKEDVDRINSQQAGIYAGSQGTPLQEGGATNPISNTGLGETATGAQLNGQNMPQNERYIICPKCGERISLQGVV